MNPLAGRESEHVMISYIDFQSPTLQKIRHRLKSENLKIWIDVEDMLCDLKCKYHFIFKFVERVISKI